MAPSVVTVSSGVVAIATGAAGPWLSSPRQAWRQILSQGTLTYFVRGSITVWLTSYWTGLDSAAVLMFNQQQIYLFSQIQTSQTGGQPYNDTSPYKVSECSLMK